MNQSIEQCSIDGKTWIECGCGGTAHPIGRTLNIYDSTPSEPSPEVRPARPTVVEVGQRWEYRYFDGGTEEVTLAKYDPEKKFWRDTKDAPWDMKINDAECLAKYTYLGMAPAPTTPEAPREPPRTELDRAVEALASIPVWGCRLGSACHEHNKPVREPWVPSVDFEDLLPDA